MAKKTGSRKRWHFVLDVTLTGIKPAVWRRVLVRADRTLAQLHQIIQIVMGWSDSHLHVFTAGDGEPYSNPSYELDAFEGGEVGDEGRVRINKVLPYNRAVLKYTYDFGDDWTLSIKRVKAMDDLPSDMEPFLVQGERASPPEDVGGVDGYARFLEALADPEHEEHEERVAWLGEPFDPERFDVAAVTADLRKAFPRATCR